MIKTRQTTGTAFALSIIALGGGLSAALGGCAMMAAPTGTISRDAAARSGDWHDVATEADRQRIRGWWQAWADGLASARAHGNGAAVTAEGALLDPAAALPNPHLPPGDYACRVIKLGTPAGSSLAYVAYPRFRCRVAAEQDIFSFTKLTGSQRQVGLIFDDSDRRKIFLGTLMLGDETRALDYGADAERNLAGLVERIGPNRWRIVFPRPAFESMVDVMELVPEA
jgi:hypothetical protein